jgi:hypothetical protein
MVLKYAPASELGAAAAVFPLAGLAVLYAHRRLGKPDVPMIEAVAEPGE